MCPECVVAQGGIITETDRTLKLFLCLPVRWDDRSESWFKTFCILIRFQTLVSEQKIK